MESNVDDNREWNYDRIVQTQAAINMVQSDMMTIIYRGYVNDGMKARMVEFLRRAADDIDSMECGK